MNARLPTKRDLKFFLAEDIRPEANGKVSLIGLIPGERLAIHGPSPGPNIAFAIPGMSFLFVVTGTSVGQFPARFRITAPDKKTIVLDTPSDEPIRKLLGKPAVFGTTCRPFAGPSFGTYTVRLELGKAGFSFPITVEKAPDRKIKLKP